LILIIIGVVGAGKTTVGTLLARKLGWQFADADDFHPEANKKKISRGIPLDDDDRAPWLSALRHSILKWTGENQNVVLACSALKRSYRDELRADGVHFVYLEGSPALIQRRLARRRGHFANGSILESQFADLEEPSHAIVVKIDRQPDEIAEEIIARLKA
jgi:gluconokinase